MYCGDETGAFIGDVGSHTARFGYGGEDCPKVVVPSAVYSHSSTSNNSSSSGTSHHGNSRRGKYSAPVSLLRIPPDDCFSASGDGGGDDVGFVPIYQSMNSNNQNKYPSGNIADGGLIQDIDAWASLWEYSFQALCVRGKGKHTMGHKYHLQEPELQQEAESLSQPQTISSQSNFDGLIDHPLLAVDSISRTVPTKTQEKQRALMLETMFEYLSAPAVYIAPSSMLSSFAHGRQTSLIVDVGHSGSTVTPLVDGYCLNNGSVSSGRGGRWLGSIQRSVLEGVWDVNGSSVNKWNMWGDGSKGSGFPPCRGDGVTPRYLLHPNLPENYPDSRVGILKRSPFHSMTIHEVMYEMMTSSHTLPLDLSKAEWAPFCGYGVKDEDNSGDSTGVVSEVDMMDADNKEDDDEEEGLCYVLPDGTRVDVAKSRAGKDLCRMPELLFSEKLPSFTQPSTNDSNDYADNMLPLQQLVRHSLTQILDVDLRKELSSNIVLTGGASLFRNLDKRLSTELGVVLPSSYKYKVITSKNSAVERRYSAWIGGSILSSLGSFQQMWLSKREYEECGALGLQRFKS